MRSDEASQGVQFDRHHFTIIHAIYTMSRHQVSIFVPRLHSLALVRVPTNVSDTQFRTRLAQKHKRCLFPGCKASVSDAASSSTSIAPRPTAARAHQLFLASGRNHRTGDWLNRWNRRENTHRVLNPVGGGLRGVLGPE